MRAVVRALVVTGWVVALVAGCAGSEVATDGGLTDASGSDAASDGTVDAPADASEADTSVNDASNDGDALPLDAAVDATDAGPDVIDASTFDASAVDQGLIAYWKFDEGSGTTAADSTGGNNTGTLQTGASWGTGKLGHAVVLDGTSGYVQATNLVESNETAYSLAMWFNTTNTAQQVLFSNRGVTVTSGKSLTLEMSQNGASGQLQWLLDLDGWAIGVQSTSSYNDGAWHHVVATWTAPANTAIDYSQFTLYVDGAGPVGTTNFTINCNCGGVDSPLSGAEGGQIGTSSSWSIFYSGSLDEVGAWSRALGSSDVTQLYNGGLGVSLP